MISKIKFIIFHRNKICITEHKKYFYNYFLGLFSSSNERSYYRDYTKNNTGKQIINRLIF